MVSFCFVNPPNLPINKARRFSHCSLLFPVLMLLVLLSLGEMAWAGSVPTSYGAIFNDPGQSYPSGADTGFGVSGAWNFTFTTPTDITSQHSLYTSGCYCSSEGLGDEVVNFHISMGFGPGGTFTLSGPGGAVFNGTFLFATGRSDGQTVEILGIDDEMTQNNMELIGRLSGTWNNGQKALIQIAMYGEDEFDNGNGPLNSGGQATLTFKTLAATPEPGSLMLLGSGALAVFGVLRRKLGRKT